MSAPDFIELLDFWFGAPNSRERGRPRKLWFQNSEPFDAEIRRRFLATWERARNMFRGTARAFATDSLALAAARETIAREFDRLLSPVERSFVYLPFAHAEDLAAQRRSLVLFHASERENVESARRHYEIIARFGRFPHRNAVLGRESTAEEIEFLKQPGSSF